MTDKQFFETVEEFAGYFKDAYIVESTPDADERIKDINNRSIRWNEPHWKFFVDDMVSRIKQLEQLGSLYGLSSTQDAELWWLKNKLKEIENGLGKGAI